MNSIQTDSFDMLTTQEKKSIQTFLQRLYHSYGNIIQQTILFGSKARGDSVPDSDIDILLIVSEENWPLRDAISRIAAQESLAHDVLIGPRVIGLERWQRMAQDQFAFYENVSREGLRLTFS
jgi:predicted nucleotidyltransferase